ncbi:MAG: type II toxin-antitoxin system HicA family toxin [Proteobacteria bacterium]|nr:type II toxin-antitoxin system HicA family toxin [Pseudomonadota bacterium]
MARGFYRQLTKILKDNGFYKIGNAKGSHEKWQHPEHDYIAIIPYNIDSRHTANAILKQAGIDEKL